MQSCQLAIESLVHQIEEDPNRAVWSAGLHIHTIKSRFTVREFGEHAREGGQDTLLGSSRPKQNSATQKNRRSLGYLTRDYGCKRHRIHCRLKHYTPYGISNAISLETHIVAVSIADIVVGV